MLGWMQNGCSSRSSVGVSDGAENALTLPRELSLATDGTMRQRYVTELKQLRAGTAHSTGSTPFPAAGASQPVAGAAGAQLEITATIKFGSTSVFGLSVLSGEVGGVSEHTDIGFDLPNGQAFIDRRNSSANRTDTDVRAGPMPPTLASAGVLSLHAYVDHSLVTVIVRPLAASRWPWDPQANACWPCACRWRIRRR